MPLRFREVVDHSLFSADASPPEPFRWRMGVHSLAVGEWLQPDERRLLDLLEKDLLSRRWPGQTFVALPESEPAAQEVCDLVAHSLDEWGLALRAPRDHPLDTAGRSLQEDLCLMELVDGQWRMTAGSVCFPTRWDLPSKLGKSLADIHSPVPGYADQLGARVDRFFDRMPAGGLASRLNWSLVGDSSRRLDAAARQAPSTLPADPGRELWVRIERQTLRRLEHHDAIVFGIRIHVWPLVEVAEALPPDRFATAIETMPIDAAGYKNLDGLRPAIIDWLRDRSGSSGG